MKVLLTQEDIERRTQELAEEISKEFSGTELVLVGVLNGGYVFTADLGRALWRLGMRDTIVDFIVISSYGSGTESSRNPQIIKDLSTDIAGKHVVVIEDIIETGHSMKTLTKLLLDRGALSVHSVVLLNKPGKREVPFTPDFIGFEVPNDAWVEGYGLDTDHKGRANPEIVVR